MVNWRSEAEIARDGEVLKNVTYTLFGVALWEIFITSGFEWSLITRRRSFRWPMFFFFFCRYCIVTAMIGLIISYSVTSRINCAALYNFNSWSGNTTILCATTCLMIRTIALWERKPVVVIPLVLVAIGHWAVLWRGMFIVKAAWEPALNTCVVVASNPAFLRITIFYTMCFDFLILILTSAALLRSKTNRSALWSLLFKDGLVFFVLSFTSNCVPAILNVLDLNDVMNVIATVPAATISSLAACRVVLRLHDYNGADTYIHSSSNVTPTITFRPRGQRKFGANPLTKPEVHVTTEHITMAEFPSPVDVEAGYSIKDDRSLSDKEMDDKNLPYSPQTSTV